MPVDIPRWTPRRWSQVVGNEKLVEYLQDILRVVRNEGRPGSNTFVLGNSREGKTSILKLLARSILCPMWNAKTLDPCDGTCAVCVKKVDKYGLRGLESVCEDCKYHYLPIDCTSIEPADLRDKLRELDDYDGVRIVYLDEIHRLCHRQMDEMLLKPIEEKNFMWIASSAELGKLERPLLKRFTFVHTSRPSVDDLVVWLAERCMEWGLEWDDTQTFIELAERCNCTPGLALPVLDRAIHRPDRTITRQLVDSHLFVDEMPV